MKKNEKVNIVQDEESPVEKNILAGAIVSISDSMNALVRGGLAFEAVVILAQHNCRATKKYGSKPGLSDVRAVLRSVEELRRRYTTLPAGRKPREAK